MMPISSLMYEQG